MELDFSRVQQIFYFKYWHGQNPISLRFPPLLLEPHQSFGALVSSKVLGREQLTSMSLVQLASTEMSITCGVDGPHRLNPINSIPVVPFWTFYCFCVPVEVTGIFLFFLDLSLGTGSSAEGSIHLDILYNHFFSRALLPPQ